ncbi:hypothetical protein EVAR_9282_1 [Eumeta japonica]|uniref:Uncharacterized protein n=1 Tax=Eumeta variegata TaxID=151549 RepID=A0A4C1TMX1_EUMVA|nr:hypothetical protein EVAR_9282_1 [Eumeta japonica]
MQCPFESRSGCRAPRVYECVRYHAVFIAPIEQPHADSITMLSAASNEVVKAFGNHPGRKIPTNIKNGVSLPCWGSVVHFQQYSPLAAVHPDRVRERFLAQVVSSGQAGSVQPICNKTIWRRSRRAFSPVAAGGGGPLFYIYSAPDCGAISRDLSASHPSQYYGVTGYYYIYAKAESEGAEGGRGRRYYQISSVAEAFRSFMNHARAAPRPLRTTHERWGDSERVTAAKHEGHYIAQSILLISIHDIRTHF